MDWGWLRDWLTTPVVNIGGAALSPLGIGKAIILVVCLHLVAKVVGRIAEGWLKRRPEMPDYTAALLARWIKVGIWVIGFFVIADILQFRLSSLTIFAGALGVGIGFGMQTIVNNFVCGLILLVERTMKVGDIVSVAGEIGRVVHIGARATLIETPRGSVLAVPNTQFINAPVTNWTLSGHNIRITISVTTAPVEEPSVIEELLLSLAKEHPLVLPNPAPVVWLIKIGDTFTYELSVWISDPIDGARQVQSDLNHAIYRALKEQGIAVRG